jgi:hypothetical protein
VPNRALLRVAALCLTALVAASAPAGAQQALRGGRASTASEVSAPAIYTSEIQTYSSKPAICSRIGETRSLLHVTLPPASNEFNAALVTLTLTGLGGIVPRGTKACEATALIAEIRLRVGERIYASGGIDSVNSHSDPLMTSFTLTGVVPLQGASETVEASSLGELYQGRPQNPNTQMLSATLFHCTVVVVVGHDQTDCVP